jgi:DNA adenine methylase
MADTVNEDTPISVLEFLQKHPDYDPADGELEEAERVELLAKVRMPTLKDWLKKHDDSNRFGVREAWMIGRVLAAKRARLKKGQVKKWEDEVAKKLGKERRSVQLYRQLATALDDPKVATALQEPDLDDGINVVMRRIRYLKKYGKPNPSKKEMKKADEKLKKEMGEDALAEQYIKRAGTLFRRVMGLEAKNPKRRFFEAVRQWTEEQRRIAMPHSLKHIEGRDRRVVDGLVPYAGGKSKQADSILDWIGHPARRDLVYVEPFVGGGAVLLNAIKRGLVNWVWLNDKNRSTAAMWNAILFYPDELQELVRKHERLTPSEVKRSIEICLVEQNDLEPIEYPVDSAFHAIVVHRCTWGAVGDAKTGKVFSQKNLDAKWNVTTVNTAIERAHYLLSQCALWEGHCTCEDASDLIKRVPVESVLYLDPPYYKRGEDNYPFRLTLPEHKKLAATLLHCDVPWLLSYDDCEEVRRLYGISHTPPVRADVERPPATEIGEEESLELKEQIEGEIHRFKRPAHQEHKTTVERQPGFASAESAMVEYTMGGRVWKPDLRIWWRPQWFSAESHVDARFRVMFDESGEKHRVPTTGVESDVAKKAEMIRFFERKEAEWEENARSSEEP